MSVGSYSYNGKANSSPQQTIVGVAQHASPDTRRLGTSHPRPCCPVPDGSHRAPPGHRRPALPPSQPNGALQRTRYRSPLSFVSLGPRCKDPSPWISPVSLFAPEALQPSVAEETHRPRSRPPAPRSRCCCSTSSPRRRACPARFSRGPSSRSSHPRRVVLSLTFHCTTLLLPGRRRRRAAISSTFPLFPRPPFPKRTLGFRILGAHTSATTVLLVAARSQAPATGHRGTAVPGSPASAA